MTQEKAPGKSLVEGAVKWIVDCLERSSGYHYPRAYKGPMPIERQVILMSEIFKLPSAPGVEWVRDELPKHKLPEGAEGWFAIPRIDSIYVPPFFEPKSGYYAHDLAVQKIAASRIFDTYNLEPILTGIEIVSRTESALDLFSESQPGDILIIPAQFGKRHKRVAADQVPERFESNEFSLDLFSVLCMLITHPERMVQSQNLLQLLCAGNVWPDNGNEYVPGIRNFRYDHVITFFDSLKKDIVKNAGIPTGFVLE